MENWKDIDGYNGLYQVSDLGRVFSVQRNRILKPCKNKAGYLVLNLWKNRVQKTYNVHSLVANAFIEKTGEEVNHIDEDKENNRADNLEWCDKKYNINYGTRSERAGLSIGKPVVLEGILLFHSALEASKFTGVNHSSIVRCCKGIVKSAGKNPVDGKPLHWQYYEDFQKQ